MIDALAMLDYCAVHAERIYVRENLPARGWDAYALSELPVSVALGWVRKWLGEGRQPIIVRETGDSFPVGVCPECLQSPCIGHPSEPGSPDLNKTGGSDVDALAAMNAHFKVHPGCGSAGRESMCPEGSALYAAHVAALIAKGNTR